MTFRSSRSPRSRRRGATTIFGAALGVASLLAVTVGAISGTPASATASNGAVSGFGANAFGEVGVASTGPQTCGSITCSKSPVASAGLPVGATVIAAGARHSLALIGDGTVKAFGRDQAGELGDGTLVDKSTAVNVLTATPATKLTSVTAVDGNAPPITATSVSGDGHSLALRSNGTVWAWGANASGQQGVNPALNSLDTCGVDSCSKVARQVPGLTGITAIATGASFNLALKSDGSVWAWGLDASDQLGINPASNTQTCGASAKPCRWTPVQVANLGPGSGVVQLAAGSAFGMALKSNGQVVAWGNNNAGELGNGTITSSFTPVTAFASGSGVVQIAAGDAFAVARKSDGSVWSWGNNNSGQLGTGSLVGPASCGATVTDCAKSPVAVSGLAAGSTVTQVSAGFAHAIARKSNGTVTVWGHNASGQLGDGSAGADVPTPKSLASVAHAAQVSAGGSHTLILRTVAPAAPTAVAASPGATSLAVRLSAPAFGGGSAILDYKATCTSSNGGAAGSATSATLPVPVAALTTGKTYTCTAQARNAIGQGAASVASAPVIVGSPAAPTPVISRSGSTAAATGPVTVTFVPGANNGAAITTYSATCTSTNAGVAKTVTAAASPIVFSGANALTTGKTYGCTVKATNSRGVGPASAATLPLVVGSPAPPVIGVATKTVNGTLSVAFTAGANNGSAITSFVGACTSTNGGVAGIGAGSASPVVVSGLTTGKTYTCSVFGVNARGNGLASAKTVAVVA